MAVHPHACGERFIVIGGVNDSAGSSPCVWGTEIMIDLTLIESRFIPMRVGNGL